MFEVSTAKREVLQLLAEQPWTPTELAGELDTSRNAAYNHLEDLYEQGILSKTKVAAKTRPKTEYSIDDGFLQYIAVLPGSYAERRIELTPEKHAILRIWNIPQAVFHPYLERYWWDLKHRDDIQYREDIVAVAIYGSVARGDADEDSDIDALVITDDEQSQAMLSQHVGSTRIEAADDQSKICMTEAYSLESYRNSLARGSDFLATIRDELHVIYDPGKVIQRPAIVEADEQ